MHQVFTSPEHLSFYTEYSHPFTYKGIWTVNTVHEGQSLESYTIGFAGLSAFVYSDLLTSVVITVMSSRKFITRIRFLHLGLNLYSEELAGLAWKATESLKCISQQFGGSW